MNLAVVNEAVTGMNGVEHEFTEEEKNFVVQFAFRSGSKEDTISLIECISGLCVMKMDTMSRLVM